MRQSQIARLTWTLELSSGLSRIVSASHQRLLAAQEPQESGDESVTAPSDDEMAQIVEVSAGNQSFMLCHLTLRCRPGWSSYLAKFHNRPPAFCSLLRRAKRLGVCRSGVRSGLERDSAIRGGHWSWTT